MQQLKQALLRIDTPHTPPAEVDVAIIGAGAAGVATAHELTRLGVRVAVIEKGWVAAEQSSRNWGWCRTLGRDIRELELARLSVDLWRSVQADTGVDAGFRETGVVFVTDDPSELRTWERWHQAAAARGVPARMLSAREANATHAWGKTPWIGGIRTERDGYAEPARAIPLLARHAMDNGAQVIQQCAVNELLVEAGRVAGVQTERGLVRASQVVVAGGVWSSLFCRKHKLPLPILQVHSSASRSRQFDTGGAAPARATHFSFRHREDGGLTLAKSGRGTMHVVPDLLRYGMKFRSLYRARKANVRLSFGRQFFAQCWDEFRYFHLDRPPYARHRVLDPGPDMALVRSAYEDAGAVFPGMGPDLIEQAWGGVIDNTPDGIPVISDVARMPGLYLCTGFSGHGFSSSLGAGRCLAQWIARGPSDLSLDAFSYARLVDGRRLQPSILY
ncbi:NAD(P)/FAD-dependent oxidoreductase [Bordetella bronchiseptica]|uniref:FAD dependent oxidoreductase n=2 Tax=Bordetella bronchiseptica TaxID=518 RepID=A0ABR4R9D5_BORBO|nr:FAD-binding oxidoreductase [Bordetella bronchiseptica]SHQ16932.1 glycine cleavage system T protein (aminomethyltransferase) [Mycobacteroides abscessus subsp. abscessus]AWP73227.1 amino acid deaminase [Bordetella bronchiseptica]AZW10767.1 FAD-binding oxidoreductase [Bordetella bronchiseptica]AZW20027.1 FAD-binding oxidoreductase [Bordetella bronchiseptica]KCV31293.1 FAD dependent oxidoreductase [Bordetella bronchiseptica 00-P-2796]